MAEIILVGTFHYPERFAIFSDDAQNQIDTFTDRLASFYTKKSQLTFRTACRMNWINYTSRVIIIPLERN